MKESLVKVWRCRKAALYLFQQRGRPHYFNRGPLGPHNTTNMKTYNDFQEWLVAYLKYLLTLNNEKGEFNDKFRTEYNNLFDPSCYVNAPRLADSVTNRAKLYILIDNYAHDVMAITNNGDFTKPMNWPKKAKVAYGFGRNAEYNWSEYRDITMNKKGEYSGCCKNYFFYFLPYLKEHLGWSTYTPERDIKLALGSN